MTQPKPSTERREGRVIFLDVDGVLNHKGVFRPGNPAPLCPEACRRFRLVIEKTGASVVVSSTWRLGHANGGAGIDKLRAHGVLDHLHGDWRTVEATFEVVNGIVRREGNRGWEISEWLLRHPEVTEYAIVDDDSDMLPEQSSRFVQTSFEDGLTDRHAEALIGLFSEHAAKGSTENG